MARWPAWMSTPTALGFGGSTLDEEWKADPHPNRLTATKRSQVIHAQVKGADPPYGLHMLPGLRSVTFRGCGTVEVAVDLGARERFRYLNAWSCQIESLEGLPDLMPHLEMVDVTVGRIQDIRPLLDLPELWSASLAGNPLDEHSFFEVYPELIRRNLCSPKSNDEDLIREEEWRLMQFFLEKNLALSAYRVGKRTRVNAPGHLVWDNAEGMAVSLGCRQWVELVRDNPGATEKELLELARLKKRREKYRDE